MRHFILAFIAFISSSAAVEADTIIFDVFTLKVTNSNDSSDNRKITDLELAIVDGPNHSSGTSCSGAYWSSASADILEGGDPTYTIPKGDITKGCGLILKYKYSTLSMPASGWSGCIGDVITEGPKQVTATVSSSLGWPACSFISQ